MSNRREKSREEWEQELVNRQQNLLPPYFPEGMHYVRLVRGPKIISLWRLLLAAVLLRVGFLLFSFTAALSATFAVATIAAGLYFATTAIRWKDAPSAKDSNR
jgi:hypothetical protein